MSCRVRVWFLALCWVVVPLHAGAGDEAAGDAQLLRAAGIVPDADGLLDFFRKQSADEQTLRHVRQRIQQLGSESFTLREQASRDLTALGPLVLPSLRQTIQTTPDLEIRRRARACIQEIQTRFSPALAVTAARMLARMRLPGTAETLLAFLPCPYDDCVGEEIQLALEAVATRDGSLDPAIVRALQSSTPARRLAAALTLCHLDLATHRPALLKLLDDADAAVRLPIAAALAGVGERNAVPVLIELLAQLPVGQAVQAEELLYLLAGSHAPPTPLGNDLIGQQKCRDSWRAWWRASERHVDMAVLRDRERQLGYLLLVLLNDNSVVEWDRENKPRWQIKGLASPLDAEVIEGRRVLIAEHDTKRVTERTLKGEILWEKKMSEPPIHAQRLPGGGVFLATRRQLLEVDRFGKEIVRYRSESGSIITARRFRDGRIGCIEKGAYFERGLQGEELRRFPAPTGVFTTNALTLLPNGHLLIAAYGGGTVCEYDRNGAVAWEIKMSRPLCALRLPGGNTLVSSQDMVLVEFDHAGKEIARRDAPGHPCQIRRR